MATTSKKLRVLLIPFFATSHIGPFTDLAVCLATASPDVVVEATLAVTPANVPLVESLLLQRVAANVKVATYPFPAVDGLPEGVENLGKAAPSDAWRIDAAAFDEAQMRPAQEALIRAQAPDVVITDVHFLWNAGIAAELGVPCLTFHVVGTFSTLAIRHLIGAVDNGAGTVVVPRFPAPDIRIPRTELPEFLRSPRPAMDNRFYSTLADSFGLVVNTSSDLERQYSEMYLRNAYVKHAYFVGPLMLRSSPRPPVAGDSSRRCIDWLDTKPSRSVVYLCFGSLAHVPDAQLDELALGLEASGKPFLWVIRAAEKWSPPEGWEDRVGVMGMVVTTWAPQTAILGHPAVGAFVTHCGWNSVLETVAAGVPVLTWPMVFEQFITEKLLTEVLGIGERLWPGVRSTRHEESEVIPAQAVASALTAFMRPGGPVKMARSRVMNLAATVCSAMADEGSSRRDLRRLVDDLLEAKKAAVSENKICFE